MSRSRNLTHFATFCFSDRLILAIKTEEEVSIKLEKLENDKEAELPIKSESHEEAQNDVNVNVDEENANDDDDVDADVEEVSTDGERLQLSSPVLRNELNSEGAQSGCSRSDSDVKVIFYDCYIPPNLPLLVGRFLGFILFWS